MVADRALDGNHVIYSICDVLRLFMGVACIEDDEFEVLL